MNKIIGVIGYEERSSREDYNLLEGKILEFLNKGDIILSVDYDLVKVIAEKNGVILRTGSEFKVITDSDILICCIDTKKSNALTNIIDMLYKKENNKLYWDKLFLV